MALHAHTCIDWHLLKSISDSNQAKKRDSNLQEADGTVSDFFTEDKKATWEPELGAVTT